MGLAMAVMLSGCGGGGGGGSSSGGDDSDITMSVSSLSPVDGASDVAISTTLVATLSQAIDCAALPADPLVLVDGALNSVSGSVNCSGATLSFTPADSLVSTTTYTATLKAGISEASGEALASPVSWSFTTAADTTAPTVSNVTPTDGATDVALAATLTASFDEALDCSTVSASSFTLSDGSSVSGSVGCSGSEATFTPAAELAYSTTYTATLTTAVSDSVGNSLETAYSWSFTTAAESTAPTVSSVTPVDGATDVARTTTVTATFDEDIFATTVNSASFTLVGNSAASGVVSFNGSNIASLTPDSNLALMTTYTATLTTGITDLVGNALASDYSWSFTTADGSWGTAALLESLDADAYSAQIGVDGSGNAIAVWTQSDGSVNNTYANRYVAGSGWEGAVAIDSETGDTYSAQIAVDSSGNAMAVWRQDDGSADNVYANRYVAGSGWEGAVAIESDAGDVYVPQIAVDDSGNAMAVWRQSDGTNYNVYANRYEAGSGWEGAVAIESDTGNVYEPRIAVDGSGNAMAVWRQSDGTNYNVYANRYEAGSGWEGAVVIESDTGNVYDPQIAVDDSGDAMALWLQYDGSVNNVYANRYEAGSGWEGAMAIESDTGTVSEPQIAVGGSGDAMAVWLQYDGSDHSTYANHYEAGSGWEGAVAIESDTGDANYAQIVVDGSGNAMAVWQQHDGSVDNLYANRYLAGSGWEGAVAIEGGTGTVLEPQIAVGGNGNAMAVWVQSDGIYDSIYANQFE
jgi:hypothetical protein